MYSIFTKESKLKLDFDSLVSKVKYSPRLCFGLLRI